MANTLLASVAVEKINVGQHAFTFRNEVIEVEPLFVLRRPCGRHGQAARRFYYEALVAVPPAMAAEYSVYDKNPKNPGEKLLRVPVIRSQNPKWKPPVFADGKHVVEIL